MCEQALAGCDANIADPYSNDPPPSSQGTGIIYYMTYLISTDIYFT
jgi:hypothetical protein